MPLKAGENLSFVFVKTTLMLKTAKHNLLKMKFTDLRVTVIQKLWNQEILRYSLEEIYYQL